MKDHPFFTHLPPKTTGRELLGDDRVVELIQISVNAGLSLGNTVATITKITAKAIVDAYNTWGPEDADGKAHLRSICHIYLPTGVLLQ